MVGNATPPPPPKNWLGTPPPPPPPYPNIFSAVLDNFKNNLFEELGRLFPQSLLWRRPWLDHRFVVGTD